MKNVICTIERVVYDKMDKRKKAITNTQWRETWIERMEKEQKKEGKKEGRRETEHLPYYLQIKKKQS